MLAKYGVDGNGKISRCLNFKPMKLRKATNIISIVWQEFSMRPECEIIGNENSGRVDYAIRDTDNLICITEDKIEGKIIEGFAQNIVQLESSYETNRKKRKRDDEYFDYLYGIVSTR